MTQHERNAPPFYLTAPTPCPYLPGQMERKVFTHLVGERAPRLNDILTQGGFRRSQSIAYRPACDACQACLSVRVLVEPFHWTRTFRRSLRQNADLIGTITEAKATSEQYALFRSYLDARHADGGMVGMSMFDYSVMVEDSHVRSRMTEYRRRGPDSGITGRGEGALVAVALWDELADGISMVYSFYNPDEEARGLGTFMILDHIRRASQQGQPHVYLGYLVEKSQKMAYKKRFQPQERLTGSGWSIE